MNYNNLNKASEEMKLAAVKQDEYCCAICKQIFEKSWTDEEVLKEKRDNGWEDIPFEKCKIVCDDCYKTGGTFYQEKS